MPRKKVVLHPDFPYHASARCLNKEWFQIPIDQVWTIMSDYLFYLKIAFGVEVLAFVLMSNHWHLLARFPLANWGAAMNYFMRETSLRISRSAGRINQIYGGPHFKCMIGSLHYYEHVYKYVYRNPVEAQICARVEDYPYSTLSGLLGQSRLLVPLIEDQTLFSDVEGVMDWLNTQPKSEHTDEIRRALKHSVFSLGPSQSRKRSFLEDGVY